MVSVQEDVGELESIYVVTLLRGWYWTPLPLINASLCLMTEASASNHDILSSASVRVRLQLRFRDLRESTIRTGASDDLPSAQPPATRQRQEVVMSLGNGRLALSKCL